MSVQDEILNLELGRIYFLELENYEKSKVYFENVKQNKLAESMAVISESMSGDIQEQKLRKALESAENELLLQENMNQQDKTEYYQCVLRGYSILDEKTDAEGADDGLQYNFDLQDKLAATSRDYQGEFVYFLFGE